MPDKDDWWPFEADADPDDPLTALRIAVTSSHPGWSYLVSFDRRSEARPTDLEAAQLRSFLDEYIDRWYNSSYKAKLSRRALDVDGGANGTVFHKYAEGDWAYRKQSWTSGPLFVPGPPRSVNEFAVERQLGPLTLQELMDLKHQYGAGEPNPRWKAWKAAHPDLFPAVLPSTI